MKEDESTTNHILKIWLPKLSKAAPVIDLTINFREVFAQESQGAPGKVYGPARVFSLYCRTKGDHTLCSMNMNTKAF